MPAIDRFDYAADNCSIQRTLEVVGEKWTLLVIREAFFGLTRFEDFQRALGCARNLLSARLRRLVEEGVLETRDYREPGHRTRQEYFLTEKGRDLLPALVALMQWGDRWTAVEPPVSVHHRRCRGRVTVEMRCEHGHGPLTSADTYPMPGPGAIRVADRAA